MHGLVSLLPQPYYGEVERIWQELERDCGLEGIKVTPYPHFSWQVAEDYDWERLAEGLRDFCAGARPFTVRTSGLGVFGGPRPVIYIGLVVSEALLRFHDLVWQCTAPAGRGLSEYYGPGHWVPHISVGYEDVTPENVGPAMQKLAFRSYNWEMQIDNIVLIQEPTGSVGTVRYRFAFGAQAG